MTEPTFSIHSSTLPNPAWPRRYDATTAAGDAAATVLERFAVDGNLKNAYPAGAGDRQLAIVQPSTTEAVSAIVHSILTDNPRCRRVIIAADEGDLPAIAAAEAAGFRYVVDVDTADGTYSLLVAEPEWVLILPRDLEDIPL